MHAEYNTSQRSIELNAQHTMALLLSRTWVAKVEREMSMHLTKQVLLRILPPNVSVDLNP
jgi:hypothetical protein